MASEKIKQTAEQFKKATEKIGETVSETLKGAAENEFVKGSKEKVCAQDVTTTWDMPVLLAPLSLGLRVLTRGTRMQWLVLRNRKSVCRDNGFNNEAHS